MQKSMDTQHALRQLRQLLLICRIEEKSAQFHRAMKMRRFILLSVGAEAVAVGVMGTRPPPEDPVAATCREHGQALARRLSTNSSWKRPRNSR